MPTLLDKLTEKHTVGEEPVKSGCTKCPKCGGEVDLVVGGYFCNKCGMIDKKKA